MALPLRPLWLADWECNLWHLQNKTLITLVLAQKAGWRSRGVSTGPLATHSEDCFLLPTITRSLTLTSDTYRFSPPAVS